jgi:hypothetical protein
MGKYPIKPGCLPNSLSFPDVFRVSAFVFPQKRFFCGFARLGTRAALLSFVFLFCQQKKNVLPPLDILLYAHLPQNLWGTKLIPSRHKKRQTERDLTTVFSDSKFEMIFRQEVLYHQHVQNNLVFLYLCETIMLLCFASHCGSSS